MNTTSFFFYMMVLYLVVVGFLKETLNIKMVYGTLSDMLILSGLLNLLTVKVKYNILGGKAGYLLADLLP